MTKHVNKVELLGQADKDAEIKHLTNSTLVTLRIATEELCMGKGTPAFPEGGTFTRTEWHRVACWGKVAEAAEQVRRGDLVKVEGKLQTRSYDKQGVKHYITEINAKSVVIESQPIETVRDPEWREGPPPGEDDIPF